MGFGFLSLGHLGFISGQGGGVFYAGVKLQDGSFVLTQDGKSIPLQPQIEQTANSSFSLTTSNTTTKTVPAASSDYLDGVVASTCCDLDATIGDSYTSGQTWANLVASPADGAAQTDYDFYLGDSASATAADPTFTGTADNDAAYFSLDGADEFTAIDLSGTSLNKAGLTSGTGTGPVWIAMTFRLGAINNNYSFFGANAGDLGGIRALMNNTENLRLWQDGDSTEYNEQIIPVSTFDATTDFLLILTLDSTNPGSEKYWVNTSTGSSWDTAYSPKTVTTELSNPFTIGSGGGSFNMPSGTRIYSFASGNEILDDTKAGLIRTHLQTRHNGTRY